MDKRFTGDYENFQRFNEEHKITYCDLEAEVWEAEELLKEKDEEIERLQDKLTYFNLEPCAHCHLPAEVMSLATAVIDFRNQMRVQVLEHKLLPAEYDTMCEIALAIKEETK